MLNATAQKVLRAAIVGVLTVCALVLFTNSVAPARAIRLGQSYPTPPPAPAVLPPPQWITPTLVSTMAIGPRATLPQARTVNVAEPINSWTFAPTGDKLLYVTNSGKLIWSQLDGSHPALIHQYRELDDQLDEQQPRGNTLLVPHPGPLAGNMRLPSHMDVVHFTPGQPPSVSATAPLAHTPLHLHWWSATRATGWAHADYTGGDLLLTLDAGGTVIDSINVPYLQSGAMQPGGAWFAYATTPHISAGNWAGADPQTVYLLNLQTHRRLQITPPGGGYAVGSWSPDGNWFVISASAGVTLVSADGLRRIVIPGGATDAVWSPDSRRLVWATLHGHSSDGMTIRSWTADYQMADVPARTTGTLSLPPAVSRRGHTPPLLSKPHWSPDGALLGFLSFDPNCPGSCSFARPALYFYNMTRR